MRWIGIVTITRISDGKRNGVTAPHTGVTKAALQWSIADAVTREITRPIDEGPIVSFNVDIICKEER